MNHTLVIARRELEEKRFVFIAAFWLAVVIVLLPLAPRVPTRSWREIYVVGTAIVAVAFGVGVAAILGTTIVGREISDRRMSFYFTRPISAPAIWFGKLIAATLLVSGTFLIAMVPSVFAGSQAIRQVWSGEGHNFLKFVAILATTAFFICHVLGTIARARSVRAFIDLAAVTLVCFAAWLILQPLVSQNATLMAMGVAQVFAWLALVAVIAAGAWQISVGRTDRARSHAALTQFLWPAIAGALLICAAYVWWIVSPSPSDLVGRVSAHVSPTGEYAIVSGDAAHRKDYRPLFLMNMRTGEYTRPSGYPSHEGFTRDGSKVILMRPVPGSPNSAQVVISDVHGKETVTDLVLHGPGLRTFVSDDGRRIAWVTRGVLSTYDVETRQSMGSVRVKNWSTLWFETPDIIRLFNVTGPGPEGVVAARTLEIFQYDLRNRAFTKTGEYHKVDTNLWFWADADGTRLFTRTGPDGGTDVLDVRTGARLASLPPGRITPLPDGRYAATAANSMKILSPNGVAEREILLAPASEGLSFWGARGIGPTTLLVVGNRGEQSPRTELAIVDLTRGMVVGRESGLQPIMFDQPIVDARRAPLNPDLLFSDPKGNVVLWNPITKEKKIVIAAHS